MLVVTHRPDGLRWAFSCSTAHAVQGGARSLEGSVEASEHAVRRYLSDERGVSVLQSEACREVHHVQGPQAASRPRSRRRPPVFGRLI